MFSSDSMFLVARFLCNSTNLGTSYQLTSQVWILMPFCTFAITHSLQFSLRIEIFMFIYVFRGAEVWLWIYFHRVTPEISQKMYLLKYIFFGPICKDVCSPSCKSSRNRVIVRRIRWKTNWVYCWGKRYMCCKFDNCKVITEQTLKILLFWWKGIYITKKSSYFRFQRPSVSPLSLILTHSQNPHWELK